jgi:aminoglycoside phosphotransferase (APT) family kinase protein
MMGEAISVGCVKAADGDAMAAVAAMVSRALGEAVAVKMLTRTPSRFATLFPAEELLVTLGDGRDVRLFVKHFGSEQADQPDKQRRDREVRVYEDLLVNDNRLPVARYFGSRWNATSGRQELYLEHINDWTLRHQDLEYWFAAARRLADLHAHFAALADSLRRCPFLLTLDDSYFATWADRARIAVTGQSAELGDRVAALCDAYGPARRLLSRQPATLVHNDLACKNVIADRSATPARICIVDWELAGVGCGLLDLVHLKYGLDTENDSQMVSSYRSQLIEVGLLERDDRAFARLLAACELHKTLYRLAHSVGWRLPIDKLALWVAEAERFLQRVLQT